MLREVRVAAVDENGSPLRICIEGVVNGHEIPTWGPADAFDVPAFDPEIGASYELHVFAEHGGRHEGRIVDAVDDVTLALPTISDASLHWGKRFLFDDAICHSASGVRIGIIDVFPAVLPEGLEHVRLRPLARAKYRDRDSELGSHGVAVAALISARRDQAFTTTSAAPDSDIFAYPLAFTLNSDGELVLTDDAIAAAIDAAITDGCDLINVSAGFIDVIDDTLSSLPGDANANAIDLVVERAESQGCLIVAAAGNHLGREVHVPARMPEVCGVGMLGVVAMTTASQMCKSLYNEIKAEGLDERIGQDDVFGEVFAAGAVGRGVDLVSPGCSLCYVCPENGRAELTGTSYATPMVCGQLACFLSDRRRRAKAGESILARSLRSDLIEVKSKRLGSESWFKTLKFGGLESD